MFIIMSKPCSGLLCNYENLDKPNYYNVDNILDHCMSWTKIDIYLNQRLSHQLLKNLLDHVSLHYLRVKMRDFVHFQGSMVVAHSHYFLGCNHLLLWQPKMRHICSPYIFIKIKFLVSLSIWLAIVMISLGVIDQWNLSLVQLYLVT